jgi:hypothetical protein
LTPAIDAVGWAKRSVPNNWCRKPVRFFVFARRVGLDLKGDQVLDGPL